MNIDIQDLEEVQKKMEQVVSDIDGEPMMKAIRIATLLVQSKAKKNLKAWKAPGGQDNAGVDTGRLRASITPEVRNKSKVIQGIVGSNVEYACILGASTSIVTMEGSKRIADIKSGDMVLTQTGEYHQVLRTIRNRALDIPNMIDIECQWRKDRTHKITVTETHKILVFRKGRTKWVMAKDLKFSDQVFIFYDNRYSSANIDVNPIKNVFYIVCNPHTNSFCNLDVFKPVNIISINKWKYKRSKNPKACKIACVYDLSIEGIHSYVASGIVVSNSYQEYGTKPHFVSARNMGNWPKRHGLKPGPVFVSGKALKYLGRALETSREKIKELIESALEAIARK